MKRFYPLLLLLLLESCLFFTNAGTWMTLPQLQEKVGYTSSSGDVTLKADRKNYIFTKMRVTFASTSTNKYSYINIPSLDASTSLEFTFNYSYLDYNYIINHNSTGTTKNLKSKGTLISGNTYEYDLNTLCGTTGKRFYVSNWQRNFIPSQVQIYVLTRYTVSFDANGGIIPTTGNMGTTPEGHTTTLNDTQTKGSVIVTEGQTHFESMFGDCPVRDGYIFEGWFTDPNIGTQVYDNNGFRVEGEYWNSNGDWIANADVQLYAHWRENPMPNLPEGAIPGIFSVAETKRVLFSRGNLQYYAADGAHQRIDGTSQKGCWRFAEHQYDMLGQKNKNASSAYRGWIDLFSHGTSGWNSGAAEYMPYSTGGETSDYLQKPLKGDYLYADWGVYNAINNAGNQPNQWRTPGIKEWDYLFYQRPNASLLLGAGRIDTVNGLILLPDNWELPAGLVFNPSIVSYTTNVYSKEEWMQMENAGAIFLPAGGYSSRDPMTIMGYNVGCWYKSSDTIYYQYTPYHPLEKHCPAQVRYTEDSLTLYDAHNYRYGYAVRLIQDAQQFTITWKQDDGTTIDQTTVPYGVVPTHADPTKPATAEYTYTFASWTPEVVAVTGDATYTATYTSTKNSYTITWKQDDGTTIDETILEYGATPTHADPTKQATAEYTYTFAGWSPSIEQVTGDATYSATYMTVKNTNNVTLQTKNGKLRVIAAFPASSNVTLQADANASATFQDWSDGNSDLPRTVVTIEGDSTTAVFDKLDYTITTQP